jgi:hypothetical protein
MSMNNNMHNNEGDNMSQQQFADQHMVNIDLNDD